MIFYFFDVLFYLFYLVSFHWHPSNLVHFFGATILVHIIIQDTHLSTYWWQKRVLLFFCSTAISGMALSFAWNVKPSARFYFAFWWKFRIFSDKTGNIPPENLSRITTDHFSIAGCLVKLRKSRIFWSKHAGKTLVLWRSRKIPKTPNSRSAAPDSSTHSWSPTRRRLRSWSNLCHLASKSRK